MRSTSNFQGNTRPQIVSVEVEGGGGGTLSSVSVMQGEKKEKRKDTFQLNTAAMFLMCFVGRGIRLAYLLN